MRSLEISFPPPSFEKTKQIYIPIDNNISLAEMATMYNIYEEREWKTADDIIFHNKRV